MARWLAVAACLFCPGLSDSAEPEGSSPAYTTSAKDQAACTRQLNIIYGALQEYRRRHGDELPGKLSDLMPEILNDPKILICPFVQDSRGGFRAWKKKFRELSPDPHTSYSYEFPPVPLPSSVWRGLPQKTWREFKTRAVEEIGSGVPIVRCHDHRPRLNLAYGGQIYESDVYWERKFTRDDHRLLPGRLFALPGPPRLPDPKDFPPRNPTTDARLIDLTRFYNAVPSNSWQGFQENHLGSLPEGLQQFGGITFDIRGVIQLRGIELPAPFPERVEGITVDQRCRRIHFLHGASFPGQSGKTNGIYILRFVDGRAERIPLIYGRHISDWWFGPDKSTPPTEARVAWSGENKAAKAYGKSIRLYQFIWENAAPETAIATIDFAVGPDIEAPFLVAITVE